MRKLTKKAKPTVLHDLIMEDIKPMRLYGASDEELIKAWESYNGQMPEHWIKAVVNER